MVAANSKAEKIKNYPKAIKAETDAITALQTGFQAIMKVHQKEAKSKATDLTGINATFSKDREVTQKFTQLFTKLHQDQARISQITANKHNLMNEVVQGCNVLKTSVKNDSGLYLQKIKNDKMSGKDLLTIEVKRHKAHRDLLTDWLYTEMEEHAKKLEIYSDLFNMYQNGIDVDDEFMETMISTGKFKDPHRESQQYISQRSRVRNNVVNVRSSGNRSASAGASGGASAQPATQSAARAQSAQRP